MRIIHIIDGIVAHLAALLPPSPPLSLYQSGREAEGPRHEAWAEQQRQRSAVAQQAQEMGRSCSAVITNLLYAMASASARREPAIFVIFFIFVIFCCFDFLKTI